MKNIIITGAYGFIGKAVTKYFLDQGMYVVAISRRHNLIAAHPNLYQLIDTDITDISSLENKLTTINKEFDTFVHLAWDGTSGPKRLDWKLQCQNAETSLECMKLAKRLGCTKFVMAGSLMEYECATILHKDNVNLNSILTYGFAKVYAHFLCKINAPILGIDFICPVITNAYGPGERSKRFICETINKIQNHQELDFTSGVQNYDFVYIDDIARAFYLIAQNGKSNVDYLIGSGNAKPLKDFAMDIMDALNNEMPYHFGTAPFSGVCLPIECFNTTITKEDTGFEAEVPFKEGVLRTAEWMGENYNNE